jgi:signal transduction histidine kinase
VIERDDNISAVQIAAEAIGAFPMGEHYKIPIELKIDSSATDIQILTNEKSATRALVLLLDNAEKYTKEGTIRVLVDLNKTKDMVRYTVEDTGIGIPASEAEHVFEKFVQLDENNEGTGIGLTVARSLARRMGGNIVLDTLYPNGARFVKTLPLHGN